MALDDVISAARQQGIERIGDIRLAVLETDGQISFFTGGGPSGGTEESPDVGRHRVGSPSGHRDGDPDGLTPPAGGAPGARWFAPDRGVRWGGDEEGDLCDDVRRGRDRPA